MMGKLQKCKNKTRSAAQRRQIKGSFSGPKEVEVLGQKSRSQSAQANLKLQSQVENPFPARIRIRIRCPGQKEVEYSRG